jgi:hypothetical protein
MSSSRAAVLAARTVGYSTGPSGVALEKQFAISVGHRLRFGGHRPPAQPGQRKTQRQQGQRQARQDHKERNADAAHHETGLRMLTLLYGMDLRGSQSECGKYNDLHDRTDLAGQSRRW